MQPLPRWTRSHVTQPRKPLPDHRPGLSQVSTHAPTVTPTHAVLQPSNRGRSDARSVQCKRAVQAIGFDYASASTDVTHIILPDVSEATLRAWIHWVQHIEARNVGKTTTTSASSRPRWQHVTAIRKYHGTLCVKSAVPRDMSYARSAPERPIDLHHMPTAFPKSPIQRIGPPSPLSWVHSSVSTGKLLRLLGQR